MTTKRQIVKTIAERTALTQGQTHEVVQLFLEELVDAVISEGRIELRNFGVFEVKWRQARKARDPRTGETMDVPARNTIAFKPSRALEAELSSLPPRR